MEYNINNIKTTDDFYNEMVYGENRYMIRNYSNEEILSDMIYKTLISLDKMEYVNLFYHYALNFYNDKDRKTRIVDNVAKKLIADKDLNILIKDNAYHLRQILSDPTHIFSIQWTDIEKYKKVLEQLCIILYKQDFYNFLIDNLDNVFISNDLKKIISFSIWYLYLKEDSIGTSDLNQIKVFFEAYDSLNNEHLNFNIMDNCKKEVIKQYLNYKI